MDMGFRGTAPVNEGEVYDVTIEDIGKEGDGLARVKGFVVFVAGAKKGDTVRITIKAVRGKVAFADIVS